MSRHSLTCSVWILAALVGALSPVSAADLSGTVVDPANDPVAEVRVTLFSPDLSTFLETRTSVTGAWSLLGAPIGDFLLGLAARDFQYVELPITVGTSPLNFDSSLEAESEPGQWTIIGDTLPELLDATDIAFLTPTGKIFYCHDTMDPILFDPITGQKSFPSGSGSSQGCSSGAVLAGGRLLWAGGQSPSDPGSFQNAIRWVKTWEPVAGWTLLPDLVHPTGRWYPGLARLADGALLVMGGGTAPSAQRTETCERFDLATETWSSTGSMLNPSEFTPSALLHDGRVLITWSPPQIYDVSTETWNATGNFVQPNRGFPGHSDHSVVVLSDGRVLAVGTRSSDLAEPRMAEVFDPASETWSWVANPGLVRQQPEVVPLPDGRIFVGAGQASGGPLPVPDLLGRVLWTDLYDPDTDSWRRVADMNEFREYHAVTLLVPDGRVVTTGGTRIDFVVGPSSANIEAFAPPYLFRGVRPQIASLSSSALERGATASLEVFPATALTSVVLVGTEVVTHWVSSGIPRRLELPVTQVGQTASFTLPTDESVLPLGQYLLFAMVDDLPSVGEIVTVVADLGGQFTRGNCNGDSALDLADAISILGALFGQSPWPLCPDACDANDDGGIDISDAVTTLIYLFVPGSPTPSPPFGGCAGDPTPDPLGCAQFPACP